LVDPGEIILIVGENGAGKTTLLRTLGGFIAPTSGSVRLGSEDITRLPPEFMPDRGLRLVLDGHRVFPELSVLDNLRLGVTRRITKASFERAVEEVFAMFPVLRQNLRVRARDLSGGQQQMLALGQAFVAQPKVLLCDEPSTGLAQALLPTILEFLRRWARLGTAIVIVEQHIRIALPVADRVLVMERGEITWNTSAAEFERNFAGL
jgi:branched-chain amino acid transport system ATP-binding protein